MFQLRLAGKVCLRLLLACGLVLALMHGYRLALLPAIASGLQLDEASTSLVRRVGIFAVVLLAYWTQVRFFEKRKVDELRPTLRGIVVGGAVGAGLIALAMGALSVLGVYGLATWRGLQDGLPGIAGLIVVAAMLEEIVYRGILFRTFENAWGTAIALGLQAVLFGLAHIENVDGRASTAELVATFASVVLVGTFWAMVFVVTRNLWVAVANHAVWNFSIILSGVTLSGNEDWVAKAPIAARYQGPDWLTGGVFGPEASVITLGLVLMALVVLWRLASSNNRLVKAQRAKTEPGPINLSAPPAQA
jgi:membrane protease YdiL (CAAX protease family)